MTPQTPIAVGSSTKPLTATAIMQLVEAGKVDLDAPVTRYLPWFQLDDPRAAEITVRHLLSHTSGIPASATLDRWSGGGRPRSTGPRAGVGEAPERARRSLGVRQRRLQHRSA